MPNFEKDESEIGALWVKSGAKGEYMTGEIAGQRVVVFKNGNKRGDKSPDWRCFKAKAKQQAATPEPAQPDFEESPF